VPGLFSFVVRASALGWTAPPAIGATARGTGALRRRCEVGAGVYRFRMTYQWQSVFVVGAAVLLGASVGCQGKASDSSVVEARRSNRADAGATSAPHAGAPTAPAALVAAFPGIRVRPGQGVVELDGEASLDDGWLEQIACGRRSREHESLVVVDSRPSDLHAALLLAGLSSGAPGFWTYEEPDYRFQPPRGDAVRISVRYATPDGRAVTVPIRDWIRDHRDRAAFPDEPWIFGGSSLEPDPAGGSGELYVADATGSVVGLVTFGDEVLGFSRVIADETEVQAPEWVVNTDAVPPPGTPVTLIIERLGGSRAVSSAP
jgi:hypothetical protein